MASTKIKSSGGNQRESNAESIHSLRHGTEVAASLIVHQPVSTRHATSNGNVSMPADENHLKQHQHSSCPLGHVYENQQLDLHSVGSQFADHSYETAPSLPSNLQGSSETQAGFCPYHTRAHQESLASQFQGRNMLVEVSDAAQNLDTTSYWVSAGYWYEGKYEYGQQ